MALIYEKNIIQKKNRDVDLKIALCYPNVYKTAMSSLGYNILYEYLNQWDEVYGERVVYPSEKSIETGRHLKDFDIISFTVQAEEDYFNILRMLKSSGIEIRRQDRGVDDPLIIAGGPCVTANPMPMMEFIDCFVIGEGEEVLDDLVDCYLEHGKDFDKLSEIESLFVSGKSEEVRINTVEMDSAWHVTNPVIFKDPEAVFKDSIMLNVSRGCMRGCRFCMSGYLYRPTRETRLEKLVETALKLRENTGYNKVVLIGAAVSDYSRINELIEKLKKEGFEISTPSLRLESVEVSELWALRESGLKTITLAPESIFRLRKVVNKEVSDEKIFEVVESAFNLGFNIKFYFLIGIPGENLEDIYELVEFMKKLAGFRKGWNVRFSINPMIPKPHTPMQWNGYDFKDIRKKMRIIKREMKNFDVKVESPKKGMIQYILSCGNKGVSSLIEKEAFVGVSTKEWESELFKYSLDDELPWDKIDVGVNKEFIENEALKMEKLESTEWCEKEGCYHCGTCE